MSHVAKVIEISCASSDGIEDAVKQGLAKAAETLDDIRGAWVSDVKVETAPDGSIREWRVELRVTFVLA